ncbi:DUF3306 domain-containing protein [Azospirillum brasilense]|uniref:DUF3306 domain-containing protein n=1 Tax=Azospirillum brasilense TaxID=192 RepID=UPI000E6956F5|nr:DUF3306 domain-containing protein [Azospirillum brasilense]NUB33642.1 DUF3306 domain-containing protein [Azospirillum brasilense]RIW04590.1 DUF3306 domain-containing protein [Azospirillum brasilense]
MDDGSEGFLSRWSRRKQETRAAPVETPEPQEERDTAEEPQAIAAPPPEPFDPESLPPVESLGADSDYTGFLAGNVPQELKRLALRKAWTSDPVIAGFRGFAEYDWDCNAPGYGKLLDTDRIADLLDRIATDEKPPEEETAEEVAVASAGESEQGEALAPTPALPRSAGEGALGEAASVPSPAKAGEG